MTGSTWQTSVHLFGVRILPIPDACTARTQRTSMGRLPLTEQSTNPGAELAGARYFRDSQWSVLQGFPDAGEIL